MCTLVAELAAGEISTKHKYLHTYSHRMSDSFGKGISHTAAAVLRSLQHIPIKLLLLEIYDGIQLAEDDASPIPRECTPGQSITMKVHLHTRQVHWHAACARQQEERLLCISCFIMCAACTNGLCSRVEVFSLLLFVLIFFASSNTPEPLKWCFFYGPLQYEPIINLMDVV